MGSKLSEARPMTGMRTCNEKKVHCRFCAFAEREHICRGECEKYPDGKPDEVYFENSDCPKFKRGEDLLPYEIEI